ncbi:MAG TPA: hypothetical protein VK477_05875, partial [Acidobacteriota bacterium]|nr:hypothetical protein [Acidobacteriota bacterium]
MAPTTLTNAGQFWTYRHYKPKERQALQLEFVVTFYDPSWNMLWGVESGAPFYLPSVAGRPLPLKAGQRVRVTGTVLPEAGINPDEIQVTVLAEDAWPAAQSAEGRLAQTDQLDAGWTTIEGIICGQNETDPTHIKYLLLSEGWLVNARLLLQPGEPVPQLDSTRVRVRGVYVGTKDPSGNLQRIDVWIPSRQHIETLGSLHNDPRFSLPRTPIGSLGQADPKAWLHVAGKVVQQDPGQSLVVRDDTGQLIIRTPQLGKLSPGDDVNVVGRRAGGGLEWTLSEPVFRSFVRPVPLRRVGVVGGPAKMRLAAQVLELRPEEAAQRLPAEINGVVSWAHPRAGFFFLADTSGGLCVRLAAGVTPPAVGEGVVVHGTTRAGAFAPELAVETVMPVGGLSVPAPRSVTLEQALTGAEEARWVELRGFLRGVEPDGSWLRLDFTTATGEFSAFAPPHPDFAPLVGAVVRVAGVCAAEANARRELTGVRLWVNDPASVTVEAPPPVDPFTAPIRTIASLRQFAARDVIGRRVRIVGTVTRHVPGRSLFVQEGDAGILVLSRETTAAAPGDRIEVIGFPGREGPRFVLRAASWRRVAAPAEAPRALEIDPALPLQPEFDARLVRV